MKKKQFVNYEIHHSHTKTNEARDHHIRLLEPLAKMRNLTKFIDKPTVSARTIRANNTAPSVNRYLLVGALMFGCEYCTNGHKWTKCQTVVFYSK